MQYLRAFAAILVVYYHSVSQHGPYYPYLHETGAFGVDLFFVISGFVMIYADRPGDKPVAFFIRRFMRIVPLYWFFTLLFVALLAFRPESARTAVFSFEFLTKSLMFIPYSADGDLERIFPLLVPGWTLNYEMYFYLIFALALLLPKNWRIMSIAATLGCVFLFSLLVGGNNPVAEFYGNTIVFEFVFGMVLARVYISGPHVDVRIARTVMLAGALLLFLELSEVRVIGYGIPATLLVFGAIYSKLQLSRVTSFIGDASYSLYLSHLFTLGVAREILPKMLGDGALAAHVFVVISVCLCVVVSLICYILIERPLMKISRLVLQVKAHEKTDLVENPR